MGAIPRNGFTFSAILFLASMSQPAESRASSTNQSCPKIEFHCTSDGNAHAIIKGQKKKINCGASTKAKTGKIEAVHPCVGMLSNGTQTCLKGKPCRHMDGAKKMHLTDCGEGNTPAKGLLSTQGCITFDKKDFQELESCVGSQYEVHAQSRANGR